MDIVEIKKGNTLQELAVSQAYGDQSKELYVNAAQRCGISSRYASSILPDIGCVIERDGILKPRYTNHLRELRTHIQHATGLPLACRKCVFRPKGESQIGCRALLQSNGVPLEVFYETGYGYVATSQAVEADFGQLYFYNHGNMISITNTGGRLSPEAQFYVSGWVNDGIVEFSAKTKQRIDDTRVVYHPNLRAGEIIKHMIASFAETSEVPLRGMRTSWSRRYEGGESTNFDTFWENYEDYFAIQQAAFSTFSGQLALSRGWNKCLVLPIENEMMVHRVISQFSNEEPFVQDVVDMIKKEEMTNVESALDYLCIQEPRLAPNLRLTIGAWYGNPRQRRRGLPINAKYGFKLMDNDDHNVLAVCGFDIQGHEMIVNHTPQGLYITEGNLSSQRDKHPGGFRRYMIDSLVELSKMFKLTKIVGIGAGNHEKTLYGSLSKDRGYKVIDQVFADSGFRQDTDGNWYFDL